jgi:hypothetical protein
MPTGRHVAVPRWPPDRLTMPAVSAVATRGGMRAAPAAVEGPGRRRRPGHRGKKRLAGDPTGAGRAFSSGVGVVDAVHAAGALQKGRSRRYGSRWTGPPLRSRVGLSYIQIDNPIGLRQVDRVNLQRRKWRPH